MSAAIAFPGNTAATFLTHFFGLGLADDRYMVERFKAMADGDIRRCPDTTPKGGRSCGAKAVRSSPSAMTPETGAKWESITIDGHSGTHSLPL